MMTLLFIFAFGYIISYILGLLTSLHLISYFITHKEPLSESSTRSAITNLAQSVSILKPRSEKQKDDDKHKDVEGLAEMERNLKELQAQGGL